MYAFDPKRTSRADFAVTHKAAAAHQPALWNPPRARRIFHPRCAREITAAKDDQLAFWWTHWVADRVGFIRRNRSNTAGAAAPGRASTTAPPNADGPRRIRHSRESLDGFESAEQGSAPDTIGDVVPQNIKLYPLPPQVVQKVPKAQAYQFLVKDDNTVILVSSSDRRVADVIKKKSSD